MDDVFAVRATAHRIAVLAGPDAARAVIAEHDGWSRLRRDPREIGAATRAVAFALTPAPLPDTAAPPTAAPGTAAPALGRGLRVVGYWPDGTAADGAEAAMAGGVSLLRRAISYDEARYSPAARVADACRALGVPPELLVGRAPRELPAPVGRAGVALVGLGIAAAAADAVLARQSSWTVPVGAAWSVHVWDGVGRATPYAQAAFALAGRKPAVALWWSAREAGLVVVHGSKLVAGHQWGAWAPITAESTAAAGKVLAADFGVPDRGLSLTALMRRRDLAPASAVDALVELLGLPGTGLGRASAAELAAWASGVPGAVRSPRLSGLAAIRHAVREGRQA